MKMLLAATMLLGFASISSAHAEWEILDSGSAVSDAGTRAQTPAVPTSRDALLHHQPDAAATDQRLIESYGRAQVERRQREAQSEIDRIYDDVMSRSAPTGSSFSTSRR